MFWSFLCKFAFPSPNGSVRDSEGARSYDGRSGRLLASRRNTPGNFFVQQVVKTVPILFMFISLLWEKCYCFLFIWMIDSGCADEDGSHCGCRVWLFGFVVIAFCVSTSRTFS